ncbi:UNVERIFIED_CONTAM: hypothetical protein PYX00_008593 [Menopon gallinae]|uniref:Photosystem II protein N n=1 Tax=Menopon gallinae TaxID=328185 RepID=A0AAW2HNR1_9NEOP
MNTVHAFRYHNKRTILFRFFLNNFEGEKRIMGFYRSNSGRLLMDFRKVGATASGVT